MGTPSQSSFSSLAPIDTNLVPTTDIISAQCPRFRILIVGRSGAGKSSLINAIFNASLAHDRATKANINEEITSEHNKHLIIHDSEGYEPGNEERFNVLEQFITERSQKGAMADRLHAIWLCITVPDTSSSMIQQWDEKILLLNRYKVPIIVVFTKFDLFVEGLNKGTGSPESAERYFQENYGPLFETSTKKIAGQVPYTVVAISLPATLQRLVEMTDRSIRVDMPSPSSANPDGPNEEQLDAMQIALATAQRVDVPAKLSASIRVGKKKYWRAIVSGIHFLNVSLQKCLLAIHKDIVTIWNIRGLDEILLGDRFRRAMMIVVDDLSRPDQISASALQGKIPVSVAAGLWTSGVYKRLPEHIRCLLGYVVDLTLILQAVFQVSQEEHLESEPLRERLNEIIYEFHSSDKKKSIHTTIWAFVGSQRPSAKAVVGKIESLIIGNEMTIKDTQFDQRKPALPSLLTILKLELGRKGEIVNEITVRLMRKLLDFPDYSTIASELGTSSSDTELLLDFILHLLRNGDLSNRGVQDTNHKARKLMYYLISKKDVMPRSLFVTDVKSKVDVSGIAIGGFGRVFRGEHKGQPVALKVLSRGHKHGSHRKDGGREALAWRSLKKHSHILPLLGVYEDKLQLFLVLPFMMNGTLTEWRRKQPPLIDVHKRMLEVAEAVQYIHSEGIVHGDLRGENVLLGDNLQCQLADTGLTQNSDAIVTLSASAFLFNYAAPELFVMQSEGDVHHEDRDAQKGGKTTKTDVYAFGCLYYAIFFNTVPFQGKFEYQIMRLVTSGGRPLRLDSPKIENNIWHIMQSCWKNSPSARPTVEDLALPFFPYGSAVILKHLTHRIRAMRGSQ
ncbi:kinase-like domain-containing protein [Amanita rubescens]|nr:kinase-like domain-containing protein [Amanita rubescens]